MAKLSRDELVRLILSARSGDDDAFNRLIVEYTPLINSLLAKSALSTSEYFNEACVGLYKAVCTYNVDQDGVTFGLYASILISRVLADARRHADATDRISDLDVETIAVTDGTLDRLEREEESAAFRSEARALLSDYEYHVFLLMLRGYKSSAIAAHLGTTAKSVDNAKNRILKKLRDGLKPRRT